jgi:peptidoglycan/xylan/chitin deacetylase (PgdA/CDA1 family)
MASVYLYERTKAGFGLLPVWFANMHGRLFLSAAAVAMLVVAALSDSDPIPKQKVGLTLKAHAQAVAFALVNPAKLLTTDPNWVDAAREVYADQPRLKSELQRLKPAELKKYVLRRGSERGLKLALTFDDGPHPLFTPKLIAILQKEKVPATFFVIGHMVESYPDLLRQLEAAGFEVGNHTYSHVTMTKITDQQADTEYRADNDAIRNVLGKNPRYCRPPGGDFDLNVLEAAVGEGLTTVLWTDDPGDYTNPGDKIVLETETAAISSGGIVLLHDGSQDTVDTLSEFIQSCKRRGFHFVTLDELQKP